MATPHVAGVAALIWEKFPSFTALQVRQQLLSTAEDLGEIGRDNTYGRGLADALAAMSPACLQDSDCDDGNHCTTDTCIDTICYWTENPICGIPELPPSTPLTFSDNEVGKMRTYWVHVDPGDTVICSITGRNGDADMYVRFDEPPTTGVFACRPFLVGSNELCVLPAVGYDNRYLFVGILAYESYTDLTLKCVGPCVSDGVCNFDTHFDCGAGVGTNNCGRPCTKDLGPCNGSGETCQDNVCICNPITCTPEEALPTTLPTEQPSLSPSVEPTVVPTSTLSEEPSAVPSSEPTFVPTMIASEEPSIVPSNEPTQLPTKTFSEDPSSFPSIEPTLVPTVTLSEVPSVVPSSDPTFVPTIMASEEPSVVPTIEPSQMPTRTVSEEQSAFPSTEPTLIPTTTLSEEPSAVPSSEPTVVPTTKTSEEPSVVPSSEPTFIPTEFPSFIPSIEPTLIPTNVFSEEPSVVPSSEPTNLPTNIVSETPSSVPTLESSDEPSISPSSTPSLSISMEPSSIPSSEPTSAGPSYLPSSFPTSTLSEEPSNLPSSEPTLVGPSSSPSTVPTTSLSEEPSGLPSSEPTFAGPSIAPSSVPTKAVSEEPSAVPSSQPTIGRPSIAPSSFPTKSLSDEPSSICNPSICTPDEGLNCGVGATGRNNCGESCTISDDLGSCNTAEVCIGNVCERDPMYGQLQILSVENVNTEWVTVSLNPGFLYPVPICTVEYHDGDGEDLKPSVIRMQNVQPSSFDIKLQNPSDDPDLTSLKVSCIVAEEGIFDLPNGKRFEAHTMTSTKTAGSSNWVFEDPNIDLNYFSSPVVLGQVMTNNDASWSVFIAVGDDKADIPSVTGGFRVSKHVGEDNVTTRADETIGFIVIDAQHDSWLGIEYEAGVSTDTIQGYRKEAWDYPFNSEFSSVPEFVVLTQSGMDGGNGSWAVASDNTSNTSLSALVDEDQLIDTDRFHTSEQVAYIAFATTSSANSAMLPLTKIA